MSVERGRFVFSRQCPGRARGEERSDAGSASFRSSIFRVVIFTVLSALAFVCWGSNISCAQQQDDGVYARAVEYCRGNGKRPMALDRDKRTLCFDAELLPAMDISLAEDLAEEGLFVVRSFGGNVVTAIALADLLRDRRATVVVYDYCLSACASYLMVASTNTFVVKDSLVAWHHTSSPLYCPSLEVPKDGGPKRLEKSPCFDAPPEYQSGYREFQRLNDRFCATRFFDPLFEWPPESFTIRKILKGMFEGTGTYPDVFWTWNPRHHASTIKTKIVYEAYPDSQAMVDSMASKLRLRRVIYDP
jgi:hypothetical protein